MADLDVLARRLTDAVTLLAGRARVLAGGVLVIVLVATVACVGLAIAGLDGTAQTVMAVAGIVLGLGAAAAAWLARWRIGVARRGAHELIGEVRILLDRDAGAQRQVIDVVEASDRDGGEGSVIVLSRQFFQLREGLGDRVDDFANLTAAITAVTSFPGLIALALVATCCLGGIGFLFFLIWIL
jgi:hypothetical protein